uniref:Replication associated protein n=1 Tax=Marmot associated feces virus 3 TaxID=2800898 RepID=A0A7T7DFT8_9VIRU|nr:replication associated protein [Marmot associated feces virus 3]
MTTEVMDTPDTGNTICVGSRIFRARAFQLTLNETKWYESLKSEFLKLKSMKYLISCKEKAPTTEHEHIHIYVQFSNPYRLNKTILSFNAHIEICRGSPSQNIAYIEKNGDILDEIGEKPKQGLKTTKELLQCKNIEEIDWRQINTYNKLHENEEIDIDELQKDIIIYYISGASGIGKTEKAKEIIRENKEKYGTKVSLVKYENGFWINTGSNRNIALYDDFRDSHMKPSEFINFIDYNRHPMNMKGGSCINDYKLIIITSVQKLNDLYKNVAEEPRKQWIRRITKNIDMDALEFQNLEKEFLE